MYYFLYQLLSKPKFSGVEKIKTIGSTYMAATGLNAMPGPENTQACTHTHTHTHTHKYTNTCTHARTHTRTHARRQTDRQTDTSIQIYLQDKVQIYA